MTWTDHGGTSPADRHLLVLLGLVASSVAACFVVLPLDLLWNYAMNDLVGPRDHIAFVRTALESVVVLGAVQALAVHRWIRLSLPRTVVGCVLVTLSVFSAVGVLYAVASLTPELDPAVGAEWSDTACSVAAVLLGAVTVASLCAGRHALSPSPLPRRPRR